MVKTTLIIGNTTGQYYDLNDQIERFDASIEAFSQQ